MASRVEKPKVLALQGVQRSFAGEIADQARIIYAAASRIQQLEAAMAREATLIAGPRYEQDHAVTFDGHGSIEYQLENYGMVEYGAGIEDIARKALEIAQEAEDVAGIHEAI